MVLLVRKVCAYCVRDGVLLFLCAGFDVQLLTVTCVRHKFDGSQFRQTCVVKQTTHRYTIKEKSLRTLVLSEGHKKGDADTG